MICTHRNRTYRPPSICFRLSPVAEASPRVFAHHLAAVFGRSRSRSQRMPRGRLLPPTRAPAAHRPVLLGVRPCYHRSCSAGPCLRPDRRLRGQSQAGLPHPPRHRFPFGRTAVRTQKGYRGKRGPCVECGGRLSVVYGRTVSGARMRGTGEGGRGKRCRGAVDGRWLRKKKREDVGLRPRSTRACEPPQTRPCRVFPSRTRNSKKKKKNTLEYKQMCGVE
ncbi:hypothetical protein DENSPDRAFT_656136 [Dentipellis sp. KUC8613]|nr:hypothetical protein DENSPDRAFT_656136 [Dentipellis sp. KUC8613]